MTIYADYSFYTNNFCGKVIPAAEFDYYAIKASKYIDSVTFDRITPDLVSEDVRMACCDVAEIYYTVAGSSANAALSGIASESVGDHSVTYVTTSNSETAKIPDKKLYDAVKLWLGNTGLMYRGVD